jgi:hypothetical protein
MPDISYQSFFRNTENFGVSEKARRLIANTQRSNDLLERLNELLQKCTERLNTNSSLIGAFKLSDKEQKDIKERNRRLRADIELLEKRIEKQRENIHLNKQEFERSGYAQDDEILSPTPQA